MLANGFLKKIQEYHICQHFWKIVKNPFACMVVLQSIGKGHLSYLKYGTDLSPRFDTLKDLLSWIGEQPCMQIDF